MFDWMSTDRIWLDRLRLPREQWPSEVRLQAFGLDLLADGEPEPLVTYEGRLATSEPWVGRYLGEDDRGRLEIRHVRMQLTVSPRTMEARLSTPAGVPIGYAHDIQFGGRAIGRLKSARAAGGVLTGEVELSERMLASIGSSKELLDAGIGAGLSVGVSTLDAPEAERRKGTRADPDRVTYGRVRLQEVSLTPMPALSWCGLLRRRST